MGRFGHRNDRQPLILPPSSHQVESETLGQLRAGGQSPRMSNPDRLFQPEPPCRITRMIPFHGNDSYEMTSLGGQDDQEGGREMEEAKANRPSKQARSKLKDSPVLPWRTMLALRERCSVSPYDGSKPTATEKPIYNEIVNRKAVSIHPYRMQK
jgi:hypothetical protein